MSVSASQNATAVNNNSTIVINGPASVLYAISVGGNTGTTGSSNVSNSGFVVAGGSNIVLSQSNNSISINQSLLYSYDPYPQQGLLTTVMSWNTNTSGSITFFPLIVYVPLAARHVNIMVSMNMVSGGTSSMRQSHTFAWAIYSRGTAGNSTQLYTFTKNNLGFSYTYNNSNVCISQATTTNDTGYGYLQTSSNAVAISSAYTGIKQFQLLLLTTVLPGAYWLALMNNVSTNSFSSGIQYSVVGAQIPPLNMAPMGSYSSAYSSGTNAVLGIGGAWSRYLGSYSVANLAAMPDSLAISAITQGVVDGGITNAVAYMSFGSTL